MVHTLIPRKLAIVNTHPATFRVRTQGHYTLPEITSSESEPARASRMDEGSGQARDGDTHLFFVKLDHSHAIPDFQCFSLMGKFSVEAVTVGPTKQGKTTIPPPSIGTPKRGGAPVLKPYIRPVPKDRDDVGKNLLPVGIWSRQRAELSADLPPPRVWGPRILRHESLHATLPRPPEKVPLRFPPKPARFEGRASEEEPPGLAQRKALGDLASGDVYEKPRLGRLLVLNCHRRLKRPGQLARQTAARPRRTRVPPWPKWRSGS